MSAFSRSDLARLRDDIVFDAELLQQKFTFHATWGVFSPRAIDEGTLLLLDYLDIQPADNCLDLGCGYGPLGLVMAKLAPQGVTHLVDKDFVAVDYAMPNSSVALSYADFPSPGASPEVDFMYDEVTPKMVELLGAELYDQTTGEGFGCGGCHVIE